MNDRRADSNPNQSGGNNRLGQSQHDTLLCLSWSASCASETTDAVAFVTDPARFMRIHGFPVRLASKNRKGGPSTMGRPRERSSPDCHFEMTAASTVYERQLIWLTMLQPVAVMLDNCWRFTSVGFA
jgi:hypothetical protein